METRHRTKARSRNTSPIRPAPYHRPPISRWHQLVVNASSAAGTTAAVFSEESMKCLKYCLSWLQYAMQHIKQQMLLLKEDLVPQTAIALNNDRSVLSDIKREVVNTLRKVVEVITRYAGSSLPAPARQTVRGFILNLPERWAVLNDIRSSASSPTASPLMSPSTPGSSQINTPTTHTINQQELARRLECFGEESIDMLQSVSCVFSDTVVCAEVWLDRLHSVPGIRNTNNSSQNEDDNEDDKLMLPPIRTLEPNI
ncbi:hypothetical protein K501DRAFT_320792 [Backusella circina FSU 941]|nr:hypothetical protein K501DRAFT_320792 [Backusella circina FSU 941]